MFYLIVGFANDFTFDAKSVGSKPKPGFVHEEQDFYDDDSVHGSSVHVDERKRNSAVNGDYAHENESAYSHSEDDLARSSHDSPTGRTISGSPTQEFSNVHFGKGSEADTESHR